jgi:primosomal protein N' (replication factor Y) (superfamily II helicase)
VGTIVRVPLHGRRVRGWVLDPDVEQPEAPRNRLRAVLAVVSAGPPPDVVALCRWAAWRWAGPLATFLRAASPANVVGAADVPEVETAVYPTLLGPADTRFGDALIVAPPLRPADVPLLMAPEGSTLVIDPSPVRAAQLAAALRDEGRDVASVGSEHPAGSRTRAWDRARSGAVVVIGGRVAVWAPVPDLATVIVLDEGDEALEDERAPTWNARDVAVERARRAGASIRMITPAPTLDAVALLGEPVAADAGAAPTRAHAGWPRAVVVDQRDEEPGHGLLSAELADALRRCIGRDERALCVLNRKGRARLLACQSCRELVRCERCGATVQQHDDVLECARCGATRPLVCLHCHASRFRALRPGIGRVRDDLAALLPRTEVAAIDAASDTVPSAPVLIGTEAVLHRVGPAGAGADAGPVGLVSFLELDQELLAPRARAAEQALWLVVRGARLLSAAPATAVLLLQTRLPDHEVVRAVVDAAPMVVVDAERARRRVLAFPPFGGVAELSGDAVAVAAACDALRAPTAGSVTVLGPVDGPGATAGTRALVKAASMPELCDALAAPGIDAARALGRLRIDVDPRRV